MTIKSKLSEDYLRVVDVIKHGKHWFYSESIFVKRWLHMVLPQTSPDYKTIERFRKCTDTHTETVKRWLHMVLPQTSPDYKTIERFRKCTDTHTETNTSTVCVFTWRVSATIVSCTHVSNGYMSSYTSYKNVYCFADFKLSFCPGPNTFPTKLISLVLCLI